MASSYTRPGSPFIYLRFRDAHGKWRSRSTGYRIDNIGDVRQAKLMVAEQTHKERIEQPVTHSERLLDWVDAWIADTYKQGSPTGTIYRRYWRKIQKFCADLEIARPRQFEHIHRQAYIKWRAGNGAGKNTAIHELKFLGIVMDEAINRGFAAKNPFVRMKIKKEPPKEKNVWTDEEIATVAQAIATQPHWMRCTFVLGLYQAARLRQIPRLRDIDLAAARIHYRVVKGGESKRFTQPIDQRAIEPLRALIAERTAGQPRVEWLCEMPELPSVAWREFLVSLDLGHLCHHGLRSTWITRAAKNGVHMAKAKRFVNHGSTGVHEIYLRLVADDVADVPSALNLPSI